jgi:hypothetical protein
VWWSAASSSHRRSKATLRSKTLRSHPGKTCRDVATGLRAATAQTNVVQPFSVFWPRFAREPMNCSRRQPPASKYSGIDTPARLRSDHTSGEQVCQGASDDEPGRIEVKAEKRNALTTAPQLSRSQQWLSDPVVPRSCRGCGSPLWRYGRNIPIVAISAGTHLLYFPLPSGYCTIFRTVK